MLAALVLIAGAVAATPAHAEESGSISGVVTDEAGVAAPGVHVVAYAPSAWGSWSWYSSTYAGEDGSYAIEDLPDGEYRLQFDPSFSASSHLVLEWWQDASDLLSATTVTVAEGGAVTGVSPILAAGGSVSGVVTDEHGAPIRGVSVRAYAATGWAVSYTVSDESGAYLLAGLGEGAYHIEFFPLLDSGPVAGEWWNDAASRADATPVAVTAGANTSGVDAVLSAAGTITGVVTDEAGAPAPDVFVAVYRAAADGIGDWVESRMTDASGAYSIPGLPAGDYKLNFSTSGPLLGEWYDDAADAASATVVTVTGGSATTADAQLTVGASISGVITTESGEPVSNATVWVGRITPDGLAPAMGAGSAPDGTYSLAGLAPGQYKVRFETSWATPSVVSEWWDGAATEEQATVLTLESGSVATDVNARLSAGATISGVVRDGGGSPMSGVEFAVHDASGDWVQNGSTGMDGSYTARGLDSGAYRLSFTEWLGDGSVLREWWNNAADFASADDVIVGAGEVRSDVDITLSVDDGSVLETYSAVLSGVVTDTLGNPLPDVEVSVEGELWGDRTSTDENGAWAMRSIPSGPYRVGFRAEIGGVTYTTWWDGADDRESASVIRLGVGEQRTGIDAVLGASVLPVLESSTPKITGAVRVGATVKAHPREWTAGTQFTYQWLADDVPIPGATEASLVVTSDLAGARLSVVVVGSLAGYQNVAQTSAVTEPVRGR
ncbi:carboxypeptidase regulatory-like domain-containing protein [Microbacterium cremeum]|uniref:carboxypeptidase regulatory-like domain-containing protein n=1 Tax=Microbacterium cremeum TaxID=2782169 RepID=UPI0018888862|nr:carboxypeptidase regulatory-like domain-containing protein [Microbacterium cremeum]